MVCMLSSSHPEPLAKTQSYFLWFTCSLPSPNFTPGCSPIPSLELYQLLFAVLFSTPMKMNSLVNFLLLLSLPHIVFQPPVGMSIDLLVLSSLFEQSYNWVVPYSHSGAWSSQAQGYGMSEDGQLTEGSKKHKQQGFQKAEVIKVMGKAEDFYWE